MSRRQRGVEAKNMFNSYSIHLFTIQHQDTQITKLNAHDI